MTQLQPSESPPVTAPGGTPSSDQIVSLGGEVIENPAIPPTLKFLSAWDWGRICRVIWADTHCVMKSRSARILKVLLVMS